MNKLYRLLLVLVSGFGALAGLSLTVSHIQTGEVCPHLGPVPACYLVLAAYAMILASAFTLQKPIGTRLFFIGWITVFGLAASGVVMELAVGETCPPGPAGIPQCFISFSMAVACLVFFVMAKRTLAEEGAK